MFAWSTAAEGLDVDAKFAYGRLRRIRGGVTESPLRSVPAAGREGGVGFEVTSQPPTRARIRRAGPTTSEATMAKPITTGHMTNYDGWNKFEELAEDDEPSYELVEVRARPSPHRTYTIGSSAFPASVSVGSAAAFLHPSCVCVESTTGALSCTARVWRLHLPEPLTGNVDAPGARQTHERQRQAPKHGQRAPSWVVSGRVTPAPKPIACLRRSSQQK